MRILFTIFILSLLLFPAVAYPATNWLPVVDQGNVSLSYPTGNASEKFTVTLEKDPARPGYSTTGSVRYGRGNYSPIKVLTGQGHMFAYAMQAQ
jgi:hypothetical protein